MSFYVSTPIYYVNDRPHIGHLYTTVVADALARYHRLRGEATFFLTGTDEHGQKIDEAARAQGITPKQLADGVVERFRETWTRFGVSNDDFIRTTDERHETCVAALWKRMEQAGDIYLGDYEGLYCVGCEAFYTEGQLDPGRLCPTHKREVTTVREPSYFFRLSKYQDRLLEHYEKHPGFVRPEMRKNEIVSFVRSGLRDLSISRTTFTWGIPVPGDEKHVMYVWLDALANYVSALGGPDGARYKEFWPADFHIIGKDIVRFHAVYWPAFLMSAGLPLPKTILTHGWWTLRGEKISKSMPATRVDPNLLAEDIGPDALRYFLLREVPLGLDGDFTYEALIGRYNAELANDLGNLGSRTLSMTEKYLGGVVPPFHPELDGGAVHAELAALAAKVQVEAARAYEDAAPSKALESIRELVRGANRYVDAAGAWTLAKDPARRAELEHTVHNFLEAVLWAAWMAAPVIPGKAVELLAALGVEGKTRWPSRWGAELPAGGKITRGANLFPRIDEKRQAELIAKWVPAAPVTASVSGTATASVSASVSGTVTASVSAPASASASALSPGIIEFADFEKLDLRVAVVVSAEPVPKAKKLLKLQVNLGSETRQVVAGIAETYKAEEMVGKRVILLANLAPRQIRGVESQGMILAAGEEKVVALSGLDRDAPPGTKVR